MGSRVVATGPVNYTGSGEHDITFGVTDGGTPNIVIDWDDPATQWPRFDAYADWDGRSAVAEIESAEDASTTADSLDLVFTPDAGFGVVIESFDLDQWVGDATPFSMDDIDVDWAVLDGETVLASGTTTLGAAGVRESITTGLTEADIPEGSPITLRLEQMSGHGWYLAMDNVTFSQFSASVENADFDGDGDVDGDDFLTWQQNLGTAGPDGDANGVDGVDAADFAIWASQYGSSSSSTLLASVPEPSTALLALFSFVALCVKLRRR